MSILTSIRQQAKAWQQPKAKAVSDYRPDLRYRVHESGGPAQSEPAIDTFIGAAAYLRSVKITGIGRGGKEREEILEIRSLNNAKGIRGRKGKETHFGFKPQRITKND